MPRPCEYTSTRRYIMQAVMWLILGGTVALAAMVTQKQRRLHRVDLSTDSLGSGNVAVRLPAKWRPRARGDEDTRVIAQAAEGSPGEEGRRLRVLSERIDSPMSPLQYLHVAFGANIPGQLDDPNKASVVSTIDIAGFPGVMVSELQTMPQFVPEGREPLRKEIYGCAVLPSLEVITIHLIGGDARDENDAAVVRQIAAAITVKNQPKLEPQQVTLPDGIRISPPKGWAAVEAADPIRTDRRFWMAQAASESAQQRESGWTVVEVVGCVFPPTDLVDGRQRERALATLATLLLVRDPRWRGVEPVIDNGVYRVDAPIEDNLFPARAYLLADQKGRGLLTIFRGGLDSSESFDALWTELAASIQFLPASNGAQLEDAGTVEAGRLRQQDWSKLLSDRDEQWWMWTDQSDRPHLGWTSLRWDETGLGARSETRLRRWGGRVQRVTERWSRKPDGPVYQADITRTLLASDGSDLESVRQTTSSRAGQLSVVTESRAAVLSRWKMAPPTQYLPGQLLPLLMGQLAPGPMMLRTDSFIGYETLGTPLPLEVIIRPIPDSPRKADEDNRPLRCVSAEVNGSGVRSRWYVREDGTIALIEFADVVQCAPSKQDAIGFNFGGDGAMAPK